MAAVSTNGVSINLAPSSAAAPSSTSNGASTSTIRGNGSSSEKASDSVTSTPTGMGGVGQSARFGSKPTLISRGGMKFLIMDSPRAQNVHLYIKECKKHNVTDIVRVCEPSYPTNDCKTAGIEVHEMAYDDGTSPPNQIIVDWLDLVDKRFNKGKRVADLSAQPCIAVHCVAGLGRAPVMVALALIEYGDCDPIVAVDFIRKQRRGAINEKQLNYLERYVRQVVPSGCLCAVM